MLTVKQSCVARAETFSRYEDAETFAMDQLTLDEHVVHFPENINGEWVVVLSYK